MTDRVRLAHGAGGPAMRALIASALLGPDAATDLDDGAVIPFGDAWLVLTADAHVVQPLEFPGGDIGRLSVCGVVNDLAVMGATEVLGLTSTVVVEEGFDVATLARLHASARAASAEARAPIVAGDTKVMRRGEVDGLVLSTSGLGVARRVVRADGVRPGDDLVLTGTVGDHGLAVLCARDGLGLDGDLRSDTAPLNGLIAAALAATGEAVHAMKDPTRGGVVSALSELAARAGVGFRLDEASIPVSAPARAAAAVLGIDPLVVANEGKALIAVDPAWTERLLAALRAHPLGGDAARIGRAVAGPPAVLLDTGFGTRRLIERDALPPAPDLLMHEVSLVDALFDEADAALGAHRPAQVRRLTVQIGAWAGVERALFEAAFAGLRDARGYGGAALEVVATEGAELVLARIELDAG